MIRKSTHKDFGVKGMKKGQHLKAQDPQPSTGQTPQRQAPNRVAMKRLKNAGVAVGQKRGLWTRLKEGYKTNRAIGKEMSAAGGIGNKIKAAILFNPIRSAERAGSTALMIRKFEKQHGLGDSSYKDSKIIKAYRKRQLKDAKRILVRELKRRENLHNDSIGLIIAKHNYKSAIKRYNDSVIDAKKEYKLAKQYHDAPAFLQKVGNKVSELKEKKRIWKEKKRIWNEIVKQWDEVAQACKEASNAIDKLDIAVDEGSKQKLLQSVSLVENSMKKIRQMSQLLRDIPDNFTQIKLQ